LTPWLLDPGGIAALGACVLAGLVAFGGGHLAAAVFGPGLAASLVLGLTLLAGCLAGWRTGASLDLSRPRRWAWRMIAAGLATVLAAHLVATTLDVAGLMEPARQAGLFRIGFYPLVAIACILLIRSNRQGTPRARFWLDSLAVSLSFSVMLWFFLLDPMLSEAGPAAALTVGPALYTLLDATAFLLAALVLLGRPGHARSPAAAWLAAALAILLAADVAPAGAGSAGDLVLLSKGGLSVVAYALFAVAAHADRVHAETCEGTAPAVVRARDDVSFLPYTVLLLAMAALIYHQTLDWHEAPGTLAVVVCVVGILVLLRQTLATREIARTQAQVAKRAAEERFTSLVRNSSDVIAIAGDDGRLLYLTPSAERVFGLCAEDLVGRQAADLVAVEDRGRLHAFFIQLASASRASGTIELRIPRGKNRFRTVEVVGTNLMHEPHVSGHVLNIRDVTDRRTLEDQLKRLALHDPLTLLANRALFRNRVEHALAVSKRRGSRVATIFVDLDNFKKINDSLGHGEGDRVLRTTAQRLSKCMRTVDTVARLGGDEFAVLIEDATSEEQVVEVAGRIVEALKEPFVFAGSSLRVAASVGVAFAEPGEGVEEVLRNADVAMYRAKAQGKSRYCIFQPEMQEAVRERLRIEADLTRAIHKNELRLLFQPIVDLESGYLLGVEALVRWQHPDRGLIAPAEFIGVAEETGQVVGLGRWVLYEACNQVRAWQDRMPLGKQLRIAVNVSSQQLQGADLVAEVTAVLQQTRLDPGCLVIEMTESVVMQDTEATFEKLSRLKRLGVRIAIDDFGTGYSSLSYLHRFPIDILKIDRSFVQRLGEERDGTELARAIISLGDTLGLEVVAEGIEFEHQLRQLIDLGCVAGQGYYYSKPALLREIEYSHQAKLREAFIRDLPPKADASATGRFVLPVFEDLPIDLSATGTFGR
jgi:diguanylate cyclase (GGDEF)-like protein/PAS domain S-box-containing protein